MNLKPKVLIVDDDIHYLYVHEILLRKSGICQSPLKFENGKEIIDFFNTNLKPNERYLIFLDIYMPIMDGWGVLDYIESLGYFKEIKVMLLSSSVNYEDKTKALTYTSVIEYIEKPLLLDYLINVKNQLNF